MLEAFQNYVSARLPVEIDGGELSRLVFRLVLLAFAGVLIIDVLTRPRAGIASLFAHAGSVTAMYTLSIAFAASGLFFARRALGDVRAWHLWGMSLVAFLGGYFAFPVESGFPWFGDADGTAHNHPIGLMRLVPVWAVITYFFVQPYVNAGLKLELQQLRDLNQQLRKMTAEPANDGQRLVLFAVGRTRFELSSEKIRNIVVDDHYCRIFFYQGESCQKRDVNMTLNEVSKLLPANFIRVHRSHLVNASYISSVSRKGRNLRIGLRGDYEVPVSRHRLDSVLPEIQRYATKPGSSLNQAETDVSLS